MSEGAERRKEERKPAQGTVSLTVSDPVPIVFQGELVDVSPSGFRAAHHHAVLQTGHAVLFEHPNGKGTARAAWTRIAGGNIETGFFVIKT